MNLELFTQSSRSAGAYWASSASLVNFYRKRVGEEVILQSALGSADFGQLTGTFCRAMAEVAGELYVVQGGNLYRVASDGTDYLLGAVDDSSRVSIAGNNGKVTVVSGNKFYVWDGSTLSEPTTGAFSVFGSVEFAGQRTLLSERDGRRVQFSALADPTSLDALDFVTAESRDFDILRIIAASGQIYLMTEGSVETWYSTATGLTPIPGQTLDIGLKSYNLVAKFPNGCFFVGTDDRVHIMGQTAISTDPVEYSIKNESPKACLYFQDEGHKMLALTFEDRPAWVFDLNSGEWHERAEGATHQPWTAERCQRVYDKDIIGTTLGGLRSLERNGLDGTSPLIRQATSRSIGDGRRFRIPELRLDCSAGIADQAVELETSRDQGRTWGEPMLRSIGGVGKYQRQVVWQRLGMFRNFTARLTYSGTDDVTFSTKAVGRLA